MTFTPETVRANSPRTLSLVELRTPRDLEIFEKIYANSIRIGDQAPGWEITYATEFHMTNDSKHFPPLEKWESQGYRPDPFGRWIGPDGDVALPFFEGRMIGQFDCSQKGWVSGKGRTAIWREILFDDKRFEPQFLASEATVLAWEKATPSVKVALEPAGTSGPASRHAGLAHRRPPFKPPVSGDRKGCYARRSHAQAPRWTLRSPKH